MSVVHLLLVYGFDARGKERLRVLRATMLAGVIAVTACASASKESKPAAAGDSSEANKSQLICTYEHAIGSLIPEKVCREPEDPPPQGEAQTSASGHSGR